MKIVALTGAGISKAAGIATFEETPGLSEKLSIDYKLTHPEEFKKAMQTLVDNVQGKEPTLAHRLLAKLDIPVISMNVDNLHIKAGSKNVIEIHGNYVYNNIVLYGQNLLRADDAIDLVVSTASQARSSGEKAVLLVIGTSMQTSFPNALTMIAANAGMEVVYMNKDADSQLQQYLADNNLI